MYFRLMGKLSARRNSLIEDEKEQGFTLIELLVVVIIIGILAAIAIPVYLGVQNNAKDSAVQSDVANLKTAVVSMETGTGTLPTTAEVITTAGGDSADPAFTTDAGSAGATVGDNTKEVAYVPGTTTAGTFCVAALSSTGTVFKATDSKGVTKDSATSAAAACAGS